MSSSDIAPKIVTACVLIIGNEILSGRTQDANLAFLAQGLNDVGIRLREAPFTPERVLAALRQKNKETKALEITRGADPSAPTTFREHGGSTWYKGKGPQRHELDPARRSSQEV